MPIFTYVCPQCKQKRDELRAYSDRSPVLCDKHKNFIAMDREEYSLVARRNPQKGLQT